MIVDAFSLIIARSITFIDSVSTYIITSTATVTPSADPAAIKLDQNVFVKAVEDSSFQRVAGASDLGLLKSSIEEARAASHSEYRDSVLSLEFSDVDTAVSAIPVIRDRVNTSVTGYIEYVRQFRAADTHPIEYSLPLPAGTDREQELVDTYTGSRTARQSADEDVLQAQADLDSVSFKGDVLEQLVQTLADTSSTLLSASQDHTAAHTSLSVGSTSLASAHQALITGATESSGTYTISAALFSQLKNALSLADTTVVPQSNASKNAVVAASASLSAAVSSLTTQKNTVSTQVENFTTTLKAAQTLSDSLALTEQEAMATLSEYCPTIDPALV
jgi:hypothetical protein